jgi:uncharacterized membrane protein
MLNSLQVMIIRTKSAAFDYPIILSIYFWHSFERIEQKNMILLLY